MLLLHRFHQSYFKLVNSQLGTKEIIISYIPATLFSLSFRVDQCTTDVFHKLIWYCLLNSSLGAHIK